MKKAKMMLCFCMAALLLFFAACGGENNNTGGQTAGRYVETDITPLVGEENLLDVLKTPEGSLVTYGQGMKTKYESTDGGVSWQESDGPGATHPELENATSISMGDDGSVLVMCMNTDEVTHESNVSLYVVLPDGAVQPFAQEGFDEAVATGKMPYVSTFMALPRGKVLFSYSYGGGMVVGGGEEAAGSQSTEEQQDVGSSEEPTPESVEDAGSGEPDSSMPQEDDGMYVNTNVGDYRSITGIFDLATGEMLADLQDVFLMTAAADAENLYLLGYSGEIEIYGLADGKLKSSTEGSYHGDSFSMGGALTVGEDGSVYTLDAKQMQRMDASGNVETVFSSAPFAVGGADTMVAGMVQMDDGAFVVRVLGADGVKLYKYHFDPDAAVDPNKVLNIWALRDNSTVRTAVSQFMQAHPDATVNLEVALQGEETTQEVQDVLQGLNTRILAGEGPDVLVLDGTPLESYAEKGMLLDLSNVLDTSGMFSQIIDPFKGENGLFYLPTRFKVPTLLGATDIKTLDDVVSVIENGVAPSLADYDTADPFASIPEEERPAFAFEDLREVFNLIWSTSAPAVVTDEGLDVEAYTQFLQVMKSISDKYGLGQENEAGAFGMMSIGLSSGEVSSISGSPIAYISGRSHYAGFTLGELASSATFTHMGPGEPIGWASFPGLCNGSWQPFVQVGINAATNVQDLAVEFLQLMLSDEVQGARTIGFPVTQTGAQIQIDTLNEEFSENEYQGGFSFDMQQLINSLQTPVQENYHLAETVFEMVRQYCAQEKNLDETIQQTQQELSTYLAEQA